MGSIGAELVDALDSKTSLGECGGAEGKRRDCIRYAKLPIKASLAIRYPVEPEANPAVRAEPESSCFQGSGGLLQPPNVAPER